MSRASLRLLVVAWAASLLIAAPAAALTFTFVKITDSTSAVPGGTGTFIGNFGNPSVDGGKVVFSGGVSTNAGIYSNASGSLQPVAKTGDAIPGGTGGFFVLDPQNFEAGVVPFRGNGSSSQLGIYSVPALGGNVSVVADLNTAVPGGTGNFTSIGGGADYSAGEYLIRSNGGIYRGTPGSLSVVADTNTAIPGGTGNFTLFTGNSLDNGQAVFLANGGIYSTSTGGLVAVADGNTAIPNALGNFTSIANPVVDNGDILFRGGGINNQFGMYVSSSGGLSVIADVFTAAPGSTGNFISFGFNYAIEGGSVAFIAADISQNNALYTNIGGVLSRVVGVGDTFDGRTVSNISIGFDSIEGSLIAFEAAFTDGSSGVYTAVPEPGELLLLVIAGALPAARRRRRSLQATAAPDIRSRPRSQARPARSRS